MKQTTRKLTSLILAGVLSVGTVVPVVAADGDKSNAAGQKQTETTDRRVPDTKVKSFAEAAEDVRNIAKEYRPKIQAAKKEGKKKQARQHAADARSEMKEAIESQDGISMKEYRNISRKARQDKELTKRIRSEMDGGNQKSGSDSQS